jgi:hypothetical protein
MNDFVEFVRCLAWFVVIVVCMDIAFWGVIAAKETYQYNTAHARDDARLRAECIAHPPKDNSPLSDVDNFLCAPYLAKR